MASSEESTGTRTNEWECACNGVRHIDTDRKCGDEFPEEEPP